MGLFDGWREGNKPRQQYWGGDQYNLSKTRAQAATAIYNSEGRAADAINKNYRAADAANTKLSGVDFSAAQMQQRQQRAEEASAAGFGGSMDDYRSGRSGILRSADQIEADANALQENYRRTADKQFGLNQDRNTRSALAVGSRGGAQGLRTALASSAQSNADAAGQAEITRAQEENNLAQLKQAGLVQAAGIRSGVSSQDQSAAGIFAGREQGAVGAQQGAMQQRAANAATAAGLQQNAASADMGYAQGRENAYLESRGNMENAQLNSEREQEQLRIQGRNTMFNRARDPFGIMGAG